MPQIFDTIPELGATKLRSTFPYPLLHLRERFETLAVVVIFSPFWAGKFDGHAKIACVLLFTIATGSPPQYETKIQKGGIQTGRTGATRCFERETKLWAGNEISVGT